MLMIYFVSIVHALTCIFIVLFILLQDPKGGVLGSLGGGGGSKSFFGSEGASPFLVNVTKWLAILFACSSFYLSYMSSKTGSVMDKAGIEKSLPAPVNPNNQTNTSENTNDSTKAKEAEKQKNSPSEK